MKASINRVRHSPSLVGLCLVVLLAISALLSWNTPVSSAMSPVAFDMCLKDDSNGNQFLFNSTTGDYQFTNCTFTINGTGKIRKASCTVSLIDNRSDRRVSAEMNLCQKKGNASAQTFLPFTNRTIVDRNTANDLCGCSPT